MPNIYNFSEIEILAFFLVLMRMSAFVVSWPVFGVSTVPTQVKVLFSLILSMLAFPLVDKGLLSKDWLNSELVIVLAIREIFVGLSFGFLGRMFFHAVHIAGQVTSVSMGLSGAELFNPSLGGRASALEQVQVALATLFFLGINGHHIFLSGIAQSFSIVPISNQGLNLSAFGEFGTIVQEIMVVGVKISAPVLIAILFMNLTMAIVGRTVPQINVLITSLPVNILIGFIVLLVSIPLMIMHMGDLVEMTASRTFQLLKSFEE